MTISGIGSNCNLFEAATNYTQGRTMVREALSMPKEQSVNLSISEEGFNALRERVNELQPKMDYTDPREMKRVETNEVEFDYYMTMRSMSGLSLKGKDYDAEDVMNSIMETYEILYNQIIEAHKDGDRQVSYEIMGDKTLTLEEDLEALDKAFEMRLGNLEGYITCQQTRSVLWLEHASKSQGQHRNPQGKIERYDGWYNYSEQEYVDTAISMMKLARENFLALFDSMNYQKGDGKRIISDIINKNAKFVEDTQQLFP